MRGESAVIASCSPIASLEELLNNRPLEDELLDEGPEPDELLNDELTSATYDGSQWAIHDHYQRVIAQVLGLNVDDVSSA